MELGVRGLASRKMYLILGGSTLRVLSPPPFTNPVFKSDVLFALLCFNLGKAWCVHYMV